MFKGFYNLASGMLTQSRVLNTVGNNMANASTPGYKRDVMTTSTFKDMLLYRTGNTDKTNTAPLDGSESMIRTVQQLVTNYTQGAFDQTGRPLDFCISGGGFFQIQTADGVAYTRNGSFSIDDQGYLCLQQYGRVMGMNGPIRLDTDQINVDTRGQIYGPNGEYIDQIVIADFNDYAQLTKVGEGVFQSPAGPDVLNTADGKLLQNTLERSNVVAADEMVAMMSSQRALQSAAQLLRMYDQLMTKAVTDIGRI